MIILGYFFLFLLKNVCCGYLLEAPRRGASNEYPQHTVKPVLSSHPWEA